MSPWKVEKPALELCDEAVFLLRRTPAAAWTTYLIGTGPFLIALLYFWTDMTRGILRETRLVSGAFVLTLLFVWMKTCQSAFAAQLWSVMSGIKRPRQTWRDWLSVAYAQARIQPWGVLLIPIALALTIPFAWVYAYYQNATVLGRAPKGQSLHEISLAQAKLWPKQNNIALGAISAFGFVICIDLLILLFLAPQLLITFFGVKEVFHPNIWLLANTTFLALVCSLTYLAFDPLIKAFYTLRCFYGQSLTTGEDLRARLAAVRTARPANLARLAKAAAILFLFAAPLQAAEPTPQQLDKSISETLESSEYNWRFPREVVEKKDESWLASFFTSLGKWIGKTLEGFFNWLGRVLRWIFGRTPAVAPSQGSMFPWPSAKELFIVLGIVVVAALLFVVWKQRRARGVMPKMEAIATMAVPDLSQEDVSADQLPEDEWLALATKLAGEGELRLAIRALFLSALATMSGKNWIALAKFKSNRDYEREFRRRAASLPQALSAFGILTAIYNRIWYGLHEPSAELVAECQESVRVLKS
jgi:hypothetical protein